MRAYEIIPGGVCAEVDPDLSDTRPGDYHVPVWRGCRQGTYPLCLNGSFHLLWTIDKTLVSCDACIRLFEGERQEGAV